MARHNVWFGTRDYMTWVPAPAADSPSYTKQPWHASGTYLNGGAYSKFSATGAQQVSLSWNPMPRDDLDLLRAFFEGAYGPGPFYYVDPFGAENILPSWLSMPYKNIEGAPGLVKPNMLGNSRVAASTVGSWGYPSNMASYEGTNLSFTDIEFPVPPNQTLQFGARGSFDSTTTGVKGYLTLNNVNLVPLADTSTRYSTVGQVSGGSTGTWATLKLRKTTSGVITLQSLMARFKESGVSDTGRFIPGRGYGALSLADEPTVTRYSSALNREAISATFVETKPWEL